MLMKLRQAAISQLLRNNLHKTKAFCSIQTDQIRSHPAPHQAPTPSRPPFASAPEEVQQQQPQVGLQMQPPPPDPRRRPAPALPAATAAAAAAAGRCCCCRSARGVQLQEGRHHDDQRVGTDASLVDLIQLPLCEEDLQSADVLRNTRSTTIITKCSPLGDWHVMPAISSTPCVCSFASTTNVSTGWLIGAAVAPINKQVLQQQPRSDGAAAGEVAFLSLTLLEMQHTPLPLPSGLSHLANTLRAETIWPVTSR